MSSKKTSSSDTSGDTSNAASNVSFNDGRIQFNGSDLTVEFVAQWVDTPLLCAVTAEALEDHFGAASALEEELLRAFEKGKRRIHTVCAVELERSGGEPVILRSGLFRITG
jgi:hypothetical protein